MTIQPTNSEQKFLVPVRNHVQQDQYLLMIWPDLDSVFFKFLIGPIFRDDSYLEGLADFAAEGLPDGSKFSMVVYPVTDLEFIELSLSNSGKEKFEFNDALDFIMEWQFEDALMDEIRKEIVFINERTEQPFKIND